MDFFRKEIQDLSLNPIQKNKFFLGKNFERFKKQIKKKILN